MRLRAQLSGELQRGRSGVERGLSETHRVVGDVQRRLGEVDRELQSVSIAARELRGFQELLRSPKLRGGVGEYLLAELLAQVLPQSSFSLQHTFRDGRRADAVIRLDERLLVVDAKFPLENFNRLRDDEELDEAKARRAFARDLRRHVDAIAERYIRPVEGTFDFAMMYLPAESIYQELLAVSDGGDDDPLHYAMTRRVVPVSPQSFYAYLQTIVLGLRGLEVDPTAERTVARLAELRAAVEACVGSLDTLDRQLGSSRRHSDRLRRGLEQMGSTLAALDEGQRPAATPEVGVTAAILRGDQKRNEPPT